MKTLFLALLAIVALNLTGCATTSTQEESLKQPTSTQEEGLKQPPWQQEMDIIQPRGD
jgi:outer membrane biogenesis lipoprotein LolB